MPAAKPKNEQRVPLTISCSPDERDSIAQEYGRSDFRNRSKFILDRIFQAISIDNRNYKDIEVSCQPTITIQVSCTPQQLRDIKKYCSDSLPDMKRSRWIISLLLN